MSTVAQRRSGTGRPLLTLLEIALSIGGYYLLRAFGIDVLWALTAPAVAVAALAVAVTVRRGRTDLFGLLVLAELAVAIVLALVTRSPRVAALREPAYFLVGGLFCLATLAAPRPLAHLSARSVASFGDPARERAFDRAWSEVPGYRRWQRLLTAAIGGIVLAAAVVKAYLVYTAPAAGIAHAVDLSNTVTFVMIGVVGVVSGILIQRPRKIIEDMVSRGER